jgi:RHS repeat-associated protein
MRNRSKRANNLGHAFRMLPPAVFTLLLLLIIGPILSLKCVEASWTGLSEGSAEPGTNALNDTASAGGALCPANVGRTTANRLGNDSSEVVMTSQVETATGSTQFTYNVDQQLTQVVQPGGVAVSFGYDSAGRPSAITHPLGSVSIAYAPVTGQIAQIGSTDAVTITYGYDGPLITDTSWSGVISGTMHRAFNNDFKISAETVNGANLASYVYNLDGQLIQAGALSASRNAQNGLLMGTTLGSVTDTLGYNQFGEVLTYTAAHNGSNLLVHSNTRDNAGRITQRAETVSGITHTYVYTYDVAHQLTDVARDGALLSHYSYSLNGNRTGFASPGGTITGTYDAQDRLLQYGDQGFTYASNGELQSKVDTSTNQTTTYVYDALSNLRSATLPDGTQVSYIVDGLNRRIGKKVNGGLVQSFLYRNALKPVAELDGSGNLVSRFVYGTRANVPNYMVKTGQTFFIVSDNVGSPRLVVNVADGQIVQRMDYDEFGNVLTDTNPGFQPFGFAGGIYDRDTGLVRFGARDYDPETGRWASKDPILFKGGSTNLYAYTDNDPVGRVDPSGLYNFPDWYLDWLTGQVPTETKVIVVTGRVVIECDPEHEEKHATPDRVEVVIGRVVIEHQVGDIIHESDGDYVVTAVGEPGPDGRSAYLEEKVLALLPGQFEAGNLIIGPITIEK